MIIGMIESHLEPLEKILCQFGENGLFSMEVTKCLQVALVLW